jgi:hypothetical protein
MADLLTHFASARLPAAFVRDRRVQALLVLGTFVPDLVSKGLFHVTRSAEHFNVPAHSVAGLLILSYAFSLLLEHRLRAAGFVALLAGGYLHLAVDLLKDTGGLGLVGLLFPFSTAGFELGLLDHENFVLLVPVNAAVLGAAWLIERRHVQQ